MLSNEEIQQLISENELLHLQLQDIQEMIEIREEEIGILRKKAAHTVQLQSTLDMNLEEFAQMQLIIGDQQQKAAGAMRREVSMENEIIQSIDMEKEFYTIREKYESARAAITDLDNELADTASMYRELASSRSRIAELESSLEISEMELEALKEKIEMLSPQPE